MSNYKVDNGVTSKIIGRITLAWVMDKNVLRIVLTGTGECLREDNLYIGYSLLDFEDDVRYYEKLMNQQ